VDSQGTTPSLSDICYLSIQLFVFQSGADVFQPHWLLDITRFLAPATTLVTLLVLVCMAFYCNFLYVYLRLFVRDHVIICGMGYVGPVVAKYYIDKNDDSDNRKIPVVIIEKDPYNKELEYCREHGAYVLVGDATEEYFLKRAQIAKAKRLFCVTGDDELNAQIALKAKKLIAKKNDSSLACFIHIVDPRLANLLKIEDIAADSHEGVNFEFFNIYLNAGRCLIDKMPFLLVGTPPPDNRVHLLIIGLGRMGEYLLIHSVKRWKEVGLLEKTGQQIKITFIDRSAERKYLALKQRYDSLLTYCDLIPKEMELESEDFLKGEYLFDSTGQCDVTQVFICFDDTSLGFSSALTLSNTFIELQEKQQGSGNGNSIPIWIRTKYDQGFTEYFNQLNKISKEYKNIHLFPLVSCSCCVELIVDGVYKQLARSIHEEYLKNELDKGAIPGSRPALNPWSKLPKDLKISNERQARFMIRSLKEEGFDFGLLTNWDESLLKFEDDEIDRLAGKEHENWYREKKERLKDTDECPCCFSWDDKSLPEECRIKTRDAVGSWPKILSIIDMKIIRRP